ncbi:TetR/AcrR family transcriptional regulator [Gordonia sp. L191]|uniref:TetR/AcrR family transcriptional regulator n=1 Tax=Gordonia sp. L191 TaxID=2982699 RepID=UPI0024BFB60D|nr:TetR/AcrR family transcriptional regulator [Gordonia sp. L191]WHU47151.1 TetR/AcrR family transcriptional regulator [Gordonia sp. L191]
MRWRFMVVSASSAPKSLLERAYDDVVAEGGESANADATREKLLDAAYAQFCRFGIQRTSLEEVAKSAGTSRITIYRKFTNKEVLVEEVMLREFRRYLVQFLADIAPARTIAERLVLAFVSSYRAVSTNPLISGLQQTEPTLLAGALGADGRLLATVAQFIAQQLRQEQRAGTLRADLDTDLTAEMMARISASFLTTPSALVDTDDDDQLADIARRYLVPMLDAPS